MMTHYWSIPCRRDLLISSMSLISVMICILVIWQSYPTIHADELSSSRCQSMLMQYECYQVFIWQGNPAHPCDSPRHMYIYDRIWKPGTWDDALKLKWQIMTHCVFGEMALSKLSKHAQWWNHHFLALKLRGSSWMYGWGCDSVDRCCWWKWKPTMHSDYWKPRYHASKYVAGGVEVFTRLHLPRPDSSTLSTRMSTCTCTVPYFTQG